LFSNLLTEALESSKSLKWVGILKISSINGSVPKETIEEIRGFPMEKKTIIESSLNTKNLL
jgi:hypothetical protein